MHRLRCWNGKSLVWKRVKNLTPEDQIITFRTYNNIKYKPNIVSMNEFMFKEHKQYPEIDINSKEFAYLMGLYLGDGNLAPRKLKSNVISYQLRQCISIDIKDKFLEILKNMNIHFTVNTLKQSDKVCIVNYGGKGFGNFVFQNFIKDGKKNIPSFIFSQWSKDTIISFLSGLIDSDGSKVACGSGWVLFNTNLKLLSDVAILSNNVGLRTYLKVCKSKLFKNGKAYTKGKNGFYKDCGKLNIYATKDIKLNLLNTYKNVTKNPIQWNYSWKMDDGFRKFIYKHIKANIDNSDKICRNTYSNIRDGYTSFTEFNLKVLEKYDTLKLPLKSTWFPSRILSKRELKEDIIAIECTTHEYIDMSLNSHNSIPYGTGPNKLERMIEVATGERPEAGTGRKMIDSYMTTKPQVAEFLQECQKLPDTIGYYQSVSGFKRHFKVPPESAIMSDEVREAIISKQRREACNIPLQSLVADSLQRAIVPLNRKFRELGMKSRCIIPLYDAIYILAPFSEVDSAIKFLKKYMSEDNYWDLKGGRLTYSIDVEVTKRWGTKPTKEEREEINKGLEVNGQAYRIK